MVVDEESGLIKMSRYNSNKVSYDKQDFLLDDFCAALAKLTTKGEIKDFLKDLLNRQERIMLIRRLQIAEMLAQEYNYEDIRKKLGVGNGTIARVSRWLNFGRNGYLNILKKKSRSSRP